MLPKSAILFKVLLNRFQPGTASTALKCLPQEEVIEILDQTTTSQEAGIVLRWPRSLIARTHYSWLLPVIQKMSVGLQASMVAALPQPQSGKLQSFLKISPPSTLAPAIKQFLLDMFVRYWQPKEALPLEYLPATALNPLLQLSKAELVSFIDFLALYDVADAIRHIVDKKQLTNIYQCLTAQQQQFLRVCLHKKEKLTAPKLEIDKWDGRPESFINILHRRGMLRLGKALCGQNSQFIWHLTHVLDTGRGNTLASYYRSAEIPGITPLLVQQVLSLLNFLKPKSHA